MPNFFLITGAYCRDTYTASPPSMVRRMRPPRSGRRERTASKLTTVDLEARKKPRPA